MGRDIEKERNYYKFTAYKQRESYISTISHDLKIPVIAQMRALELLSEESLGKLNKEQKEMVDLTLESCKSVYEMLSNIIALYKYENRKFLLKKEIISISGIINDTIFDYDEIIKNKKIHTNISVPKIYKIFADKKQIKKAFNNIISYCLMSSNADSDFNIKISTQNNYIQIQFNFESSYSSKRKGANMFNSYCTPDEKLDKIGANLGLSLAKQIIEAHRGNIFITNENFNNCYIIEVPINYDEFTASTVT